MGVEEDIIFSLSRLRLQETEREVTICPRDCVLVIVYLRSSHVLRVTHLLFKEIGSSVWMSLSQSLFSQSLLTSIKSPNVETPTSVQYNTSIGLKRLSMCVSFYFLLTAGIKSSR